MGPFGSDELNKPKNYNRKNCLQLAHLLTVKGHLKIMKSTSSTNTDTASTTTKSSSPISVRGAKGSSWPRESPPSTGSGTSNVFLVRGSFKPIMHMLFLENFYSPRII